MERANTIFRPGIGSALEWKLALENVKVAKELLETVPDLEIGERFELEQVTRFMIEHTEFHAYLSLSSDVMDVIDERTKSLIH